MRKLWGLLWGAGYFFSIYPLLLCGACVYVAIVGWGGPNELAHGLLGWIIGSCFALGLFYAFLFTVGGRDMRRWLQEQARRRGVPDIDAVLVGPPPYHMTAVFDRSGRQIPRYQGQWVKVRRAIRANYSGQIEFIGPVPLVELEEL